MFPTLTHGQIEKIHDMTFEILEKKVYCSLRVHPQTRKNTLLRFAINYYNNLTDIKKVIELLKKSILN